MLNDHPVTVEQISDSVDKFMMRMANYRQILQQAYAYHMNTIVGTVNPKSALYVSKLSYNRQVLNALMIGLEQKMHKMKG